jgi:hypothetical protein
VVLASGNRTYTGLAIEPAVSSVIAGGNAMPTDCYVPQYTDNVGAGMATITLLGAGNCSGTATTTFEISKAKLTVMPEADQAQVAGVSVAKTALKYTLSGFVNGEDKSVVIGALSWTDCDGGTGVACTSAGEFAFTTGTLSAQNYSFQIAAEAPIYLITAASTDAMPNGTVPVPTEPLIAKVGYAQADIVFPSGDWTGKWNWATPSTKVYQPADVGSVLMQAIYAPSTAEIAKYNWNGIQTTQNLPVNIALLPDTAYIQFASLESQFAVIAVKAGAWQHLNWSSAIFNDSLSVTITPNADNATHTVTVQGKGIYENIHASAIVTAEGRVLTPVVGAGRHMGLPIQWVFDVRGNYVGRSLSDVERPGVYILRQGSQTRKIVVR